MKKHLLICTIALIAINSISAKAQQVDTTKYDLGRITLDKKFTQAVTVKGYDLEKIQFTTLSDAVNTWFYGVYGSAANYVTVIDGSLNNDINAYSVYDIEEVTLIQNSLVHLNGISPQQVLLLVKTKRKSRVGSSGVDVIGQTNLINTRNTFGTDKSTNNFYHQYYVSQYTNTENVQAGFSAAFQQSVIPVIGSGGLAGNKPYTFSRIKLNGYFDAQLNKDNLFTINAGYVPQTDSAKLSVATATNNQTSGYHVNQTVWSADLKLHSNITKHLTNSFSAGLQQYKLNGNS